MFIKICEVLIEFDKFFWNEKLFCYNIDYLNKNLLKMWFDILNKHSNSSWRKMWKILVNVYVR